MGRPVVTIASGGLAVSEVLSGFGTPVEEATNGFGRSVTKVTNGLGLPVIYVGDWINDYVLPGALQPSVALDFVNGKYYDGSNKNAALSSMLNNPGTVTPGSGMQCGAVNITTKGPLTAALQAVNCTVYIEVSGGLANTTAGILSFSSGSPDTPCIADATYNSFDTFAASLSGVGPTVNLTAINKIATQWGTARGDGSYLATAGGTAHIAANMAAVTGPAIGSYAGAYPWSGKIRKLAVWPSKISVSDLKTLSLSGIPFRRQGWIAFDPNSYGIAPDTGGGGADTPNALRDWFTNAHPWTMLCEMAHPSNNINGVVLWTTVPSAPAGGLWCGHETWVPGLSDATGVGGLHGTGAMRTHIMCGWPGSTSPLASIQVNGTKNVLDGAFHLCGSSYDGSGVAAGCKFWVDGLPDAVSRVDYDALTAASDAATNRAFEVGGQFGSYAVGQMKFLGIWKVVQNDAWHAAAKISRPPPDANTLVYYDFKEGTGSQTVDRSSNGFACNLINGGIWL